VPPLSRGLLAYLAATGIVVGIWAWGFPLHFYRFFPGFGGTWVSMDGPFNQHLIRDIGAAYLMIAAFATVCLFRPATITPFAVGLGTLFFNLPHFCYHMTHLAMFSPMDRALNFGALGFAVLCSVWLLLPKAQHRSLR